MFRVGNFLLAEILYYAKLHPDVTVGNLSNQQISELYDICLYTVKGHYENTLQKVIYGKKIITKWKSYNK